MTVCPNEFMLQILEAVELFPYGSASTNNRSPLLVNSAIIGVIERRLCDDVILSDVEKVEGMVVRDGRRQFSSCGHLPCSLRE